MKLEKRQTAYSMRDMAKMLLRVDELTRENTSLRRQLCDTKNDLAAARNENADLTAQLRDLQDYYARERTAPHLLTMRVS